ncbi:hypothetical protein FJY63_12205 [Candidatus Sumerlaeota bacterium]|nr:hypothetical protein [Candidatus Sumerlaeota bacterium]
MKARRAWLIGVVCFVVAMGFGVAAYMSSTSGVVPRDVVAGGGGRSETSSGNVLQSTIGQPVAGASTAGNGTTLYGGFQVPLAPAAAAARNWELY